jgi:enamine deaminase RidA (YjgF/YER057c/UK114 family)
MKTILSVLFSILILMLSCNTPSEKGSESQVNTIGSQDVEAKVKSLGIELSSSSQPLGNYVNSVRTGNLLFLSGKGPKRPAVIDGKPTDGSYVTGKLGKELSVEEGYQAAKYAGILQLAALKAELGNLNKVKRIVKVMGMVNAVPEFTDHPKVVNGFSDLMVEVFGEKGKHARAAVGMSSLPGNWAVEIEMIVEVE